METTIHQEFLTENHYTKNIGSTKVDLHFRFKPFNVLKENGLPCISHLQISYINLVTGKKKKKDISFILNPYMAITALKAFLNMLLSTLSKNNTLLSMKMPSIPFSDLREYFDSKSYSWRTSGYGFLIVIFCGQLRQLLPV
jgi:hypothetical protein